MKIKQVEELVGITRKNIRFYEDQGLLNVERAENGYREYHQADVIRLQEIKLFRKMDISIEEMKLLFEKKKSLQICLEQHLKELDHRKEGLSKMQDMCERLILEHRSLESLNAEDCLEEIEQMDISIEEMKLLFEKKKSLQICLEQHLKELDHRKEGLSKMQDMCERLILEHRSLESLNAEDCLEEIEQMEKEGAKFMNVNKTDVHNKKRKGAIIGAAVMTLLMLLTIIIIFWANIQDPIPTGLFLLLEGIPIVIIVGTLIALAGRMKEIEGGEEDEASKY